MPSDIRHLDLESIGTVSEEFTVVFEFSTMVFFSSASNLQNAYAYLVSCSSRQAVIDNSIDKANGGRVVIRAGVNTVRMKRGRGRKAW